MQKTYSTRSNNAVFVLPIIGQGDITIKFTGGDRMGVSGFKKDALFTTKVPIIQNAIESSPFFGRRIFLVEEYETKEEIEARVAAMKKAAEKKGEEYVEPRTERSKYVPDEVVIKEPEECETFSDACFYLMNKYDLPKKTFPNLPTLKKFAREHGEEFPKYEAFNS